MSPHSNAPRAPQIADDLRRAIQEGEYRPGHQLPSARALAEKHGTARNTVITAMNALMREGLVVSRPRAGWFVAEPPEDAEVYRSRLSEPTTARVVERITTRVATPIEADELHTTPGRALLEIRRARVEADGSTGPEEVVLLTADHTLVYELRASDQM